MVHTVGMAGIHGNVGAPTAKALAIAAEAGKIKLVIFHREGSKPKDISVGENIEFRVLDFADDMEAIQEAVKGVNVFISAVSFAALPNEPKIVDALAKSPNLVTYIPSTYSTTWNAEDFKHPQLGPVLNFLHMGWERAREKGLGVTAVYTGVYDLYWFELGFVGAPIKGNTIWANEKQLQNRVPITTATHLGDAIARIATADPHSVKNREYSVVTFWPTGNELVDLYTKVNGKKASIKDFTKADHEAQMADGANFGPAKVGYWDRWESGSWGYEEGGKISGGGYDGPGLEEVARKYA